MIAACAGLVFMVVNAGALPGDVALAVRVLGVMFFIAVMWFTMLSGTGEATQQGVPDQEAWRIYWLAVAFEVVLIPFGAAALSRSGHVELVVPWVAFVVGMHFLPFARTFGLPGFRVLARMLIGLASVGGLLALSGHVVAGQVVSGVMSGVVLLAFSAYMTCATRIMVT